VAQGEVNKVVLLILEGESSSAPRVLERFVFEVAGARFLPLDARAA
jgi:hypothetical protein